MFEGAVIAVLREHKADYGLQRIYASIGGMISSPLSGMLIDYASSGKGYTDFRYVNRNLKTGNAAQVKNEEKIRSWCCPKFAHKCQTCRVAAIRQNRP